MPDSPSCIDSHNDLSHRIYSRSPDRAAGAVYLCSVYSLADCNCHLAAAESAVVSVECAVVFVVRIVAFEVCLRSPLHVPRAAFLHSKNITRNKVEY